MDRFRIRYIKKTDSLFDEIWLEYYPKITVFLQTSFKISNPEDLVQEIMLKVFSKLERYSPVYSFNTWIYALARNHAIDALKKNNTDARTVHAVIQNAVLSQSVNRHTPEIILLEKQLRMDIADYIDSLPAIEREISFLKFHQGLKYREISRITGVPEGTVKYHVHNIKKKFADYYGEYYED